MSETTAMVETVRGPVAAAALGRTLPHEHVFVMQEDARVNYNRLWGEPYWDEEVRVADAVERLRALRATGIETIFDPTVIGIGRDIERLRRVNAGVDLNIVVATGVYAFLELPNFLATRSDDAITEMFVRELHDGIAGTGIRAAFLKCAVEHHGLIGDVPRILSIIAAAAIETGAPVMVHTNARAHSGALALGALLEHGVAADRIVIAHLGDSNDLVYLREIADAGAWIGLDRFGIDHFNPLGDRIATLLALLEAGYADALHLSHDAACFMDFMAHNPRHAGERPDYTLIGREVLPALRVAGIGEATIDQLMIDNPRRFLAPVG